MGPLSSARRRARLSGLLAGLLLAGSLVSGLPAAAQDSAGVPLIDLIRVENGTKDALDGGDYTAVIIGNHAFGVIYGSAEHPLSAVTLFAVTVRSLGTATVHDADTGRVLRENVTLPFFTLIAERLDAAFEFRDLNGDGMFNFRPNLLTRDPFDFNASEPAVKGVPLAGDWNITLFELVPVSDEQVNLTIVLTREDLEYRLPFDMGHTGDGVLNKIEFTVRVAITREHVEGATVPHFQATVERHGGQRQLTELERDGTVERDYTATRATFKVDHDIVGWDFAAPRENIQSRLMLHATLLFANAMDRRLAPWLTEAALGGDRAPAANVTEEDLATHKLNNTSVSPERPLEEFRPATDVRLRDGFGRVGGLGYVPTATLWPDASGLEPAEKRVGFQVLGGTRFQGTGEWAAYRGFVLSAGFLYPAGYRIYHDPELSAESVEVEGSSLLPSVLPALILLGEAVLVVGALAGVLALVARAVSGSAKAAAQADARRLEALKARYQLPPAGGDLRRGGD